MSSISTSFIYELNIPCIVADQQSRNDLFHGYESMVRVICQLRYLDGTKFMDQSMTITP